MFTIIAKHQRMLVAVLLVIIGSAVAVLLTQRSTPAVGPNTSEHLLSPATASQSPVLHEEGFIWHPPGQTYLQYVSYDGRETQRYDWVAGVPTTWDIAATTRTEGIYHFIWQTASGALWRTQINRSGVRVLAPIEVTRQADDFRASTSRLGQTVLLWSRQGSVNAVVLDGRGRPLRQVNSIITQADHFDVLLRSSLGVQVSWISGNTVFYGESADLDNLGAFQSQAVGLTPGEWVDTFMLVATNDDFYSVWIQRTIDDPTQSTLKALRWSDGTVVTLLADSPPYNIQAVRSRRARYAQQQLSGSFWIDGEWRTGYFVPGDERPQLLATGTPDFEAPRIWMDTDDTVVAQAWYSIAERDTSQYTVVANVRPVAEDVPTPGARQWLRAGLEQSARGVVWLMVPIGFVMAALVVTRQPPDWLLTLSTFLMARIVYPMNLFALPKFLEPHAADTIFTNFLLVAAIDALSFGLAWNLLRTNGRAMWWGFYTFSMLFCFVLFGGHLS